PFGSIESHPKDAEEPWPMSPDLNRLTPTGRTFSGTECHLGERDAESSIRVRMFGRYRRVRLYPFGCYSQTGGARPPISPQRMARPTPPPARPASSAQSGR